MGITAIYPGTFDPPTLGHLDIIRRSSHVFDHLIVAIGKNPQKSEGAFSIEERIAMLQKITAGFPNVSIEVFSGLLVDYAASKNIPLVIRSIRTTADFEYETLQGQMNKMLSRLETLYFVVDEKYRLISSTLVKEIASQGRRISQFVPLEIEEEIFSKINTLN